MLTVGSVSPQVGVKDMSLSTIRSRNQGSLRCPSSVTDGRSSQEPGLHGYSCSVPIWSGRYPHLGTAITQATSQPPQNCLPSLFLCQTGTVTAQTGTVTHPQSQTINSTPGRLTPETFLLLIYYRDISSLK